MPDPATHQTDPAMAAQTIYTPLNPSRNEIRLLHVLPARLFSDRPDDIICTIKRTSLEESNGAYKALSYAWGEAIAPRPIYIRIDGSDIPVTVQENLYRALVHLQYNHRDRSEPFIIWADAICINQADGVEKTHQVQQMKKVYEGASIVIVWLGVAADESDLVITRMQEVYSRAMELQNTPAGWTAVLFELNTSTTEEATFPLSAMVAFLLRSWWSRIWVVQEIAAATAVVFCCGYSLISDVELFIALHVFFSMQDNSATKVARSRSEYERQAGLLPDFGLRAAILEELPFTRDDDPAKLPRLIDRLTQWYTTDPLSNMVMKATDPRDFLFSLFGISRDAAELGLKADYSKSHQQVFIDTAAAIISSGDLGILSLVQTSDNALSLPSWVPDWGSPIRHTLQNGPWNFSTALADNFFLPGEPSQDLDLRPYMAYRGLTQDRQDIRYSASILSFSISVILLDCVRQPLGSSGQHLINEELFHFWDEVYIAAQSACGDKRPYRNIGHAVFCLLTLDRERVDSGGQWTICRARDDFLWGAHQAYMMWRDHYSRKAPAGFWEDLKEDSQLSLFAVTSRTVSAGRHAFVTQKGWIGMGPERTMVGDGVAIIAGAKVPFILRVDDKGKHRLVGEAYIQGVMDGEAATMGLPVVEIDLY